MASRQDKTLAPEEARRALYIDFEGRKDLPPVLLGTTHGQAGAGRVYQYLPDERFTPLGATDDLEVLSFADSIARILQRAEKHDRLLVAWTTHELRLVRRWAPEHAERFEARFRNALTVAKYWRNVCHPGDRPTKGNLVNYLALVGYAVPEAAGPDRAAETIRRIDRSLERDASGRHLTADQRRRWADLRDHNRHDCAGMRAICIEAADAVASVCISSGHAEAYDHRS
jgi:hypothetical protein